MSEGMLGFHKSISAGTFNVYQCPVGKYAKVIINVSAEVTGSVDFTLRISPSSIGSSIGVIQRETLSSINNGFIRTAIIMTSGEWLGYSTTAAGVTVTVVGLEFVTNTKEIKSTFALLANNEFVLYEAPVGETATINTTVTSRLGGLPTDQRVGSATTKLYVSTTNASGGSLLLTNSLNAGRTGYEYSGLVLTSGQKLILVSSNLSGQLICRVHGFRRDAQ